jgi:hypothetical protein
LITLFWFSFFERNCGICFSLLKETQNKKKQAQGNERRRKNRC